MFHRNRVAVLLLLATMLANCGQAPRATPQSNDVTPVFAFSEAVVGRNRLAIGLLRGGTPLNDPGAKVRLRFFNLDENNPQPKAETDATYYGQGLPAGFYVAYPSFDKPGNWGVEVYEYPFGESAQRQDNSGLSDPMVAWHLQSEPWLFLIDARGMIAARFEGGITKEEIGLALEKLIAGQPVVVGT